MSEELAPAPGIARSYRSASFVPSLSSFTLLLDPPASGAWNMAVDEALLEAAAAEGQCTLRFYRWQEPTLSLGYFQTYADRWQPRGRAAGGGSPPFERRRRHSARSGTDLQLRGAQPSPAGRRSAGILWGGSRQPDRGAGRVGHRGAMCARPTRASQNRQPFLCFQRRRPGDVLLGDAKIAGSAAAALPRRGATARQRSVGPIGRGAGA